jgi:iron complex transport system substrate-binding protein
MTTDGNPKEFEQKLHALKIRTHVFESLTLDELPDGIRGIGNALDEKDKFNTLSLNIEQALNKVKIRKTADREKILFIIWPEPLIVAGPRTAVNDAINLLGHINIAGQTKSRYPKYSVEEILRQSPDFIFIGVGKGMEKISNKLLKKLSRVPAVKNGKVFYVSDSLYRLGPRVIKGLEELAEYIYEIQGR